MAYKDIDSGIAFKFGIGYLVLTFFLLLYIPMITILNSRKLERVETRKRLLKFMVLFILFSALHFIYDCVFRHSNINLFRVFFSAIGAAFGISFIEVTLLKKKEN
jgi:Na+-driven multidrug efflux pump